MHPADLEDPTILNRLNDPSGIDGRDWLGNPNVAIGALNLSQAISLVEELYRLGAFRVVICDLGRSGEREMAASVIVQRSVEPDSWHNLFEFCTQVCHQHGWWQNPASGQALLLLRVDGRSHRFNVPLAPLDSKW